MINIQFKNTYLLTKPIGTMKQGLVKKTSFFLMSTALFLGFIPFACGSSGPNIPPTPVAEKPLTPPATSLPDEKGTTVTARLDPNLTKNSDLSTNPYHPHFFCRSQDPCFTLSMEQQQSAEVKQLNEATPRADVVMLFSPTCPHCGDYITDRLPTIEKMIKKENIRIHIGFNPLNPLDLEAIKIIVEKNKIKQGDKGADEFPNGFLTTLIKFIKNPTTWFMNTVELNMVLELEKMSPDEKIQRMNKKNITEENINQIKINKINVINKFLENISDAIEKKKWEIFLNKKEDSGIDLTYFKIFCGKDSKSEDGLGLEPEFIEKCIANKELSQKINEFPNIIAHGECDHAPYFSINGVSTQGELTGEILLEKLKVLDAVKPQRDQSSATYTRTMIPLPKLDDTSTS